MERETLEKAKELQNKIHRYERLLGILEKQQSVYICEWSSFESYYSCMARLIGDDVQILKETVEKMLNNAKEEFEEL